MKIAMFGHKRIPSREGGVEIVVEQLSTRMTALGHSVTVYNRKGHHIAGNKFDNSKLDTLEGVRLKSVPTINGKGLAAVSSSFFACIAVSFGRYDIVHIHAEGPAFMCWLPKLLGKKVIVTVHGLDHQRAKWGKFASSFIMLGEKNAVKYADEIIVLSKNVQKYFMDRYGRKTCFIPNGIDKPEILQPNIIEKQYGLVKNGYLLYLGRIVPEKGLDYLLDAFKKIATDKKLVIAGGSSDTQSYLESLREKAKADNRIIFTGFVQGELLSELYSNAYLYILPSDVEGMPLSLLEAMSYGNCCLVSDIPECAEVVENNAFLFKKGDTDDLKDKLQTLIDAPNKCHIMAEKSREYILNKYCWCNVIDKTLEVYQ